MTLISFGQVFIVCLLGAMSPGPSMAVVIHNAIFKGRYNGILTSIGHGVGIAIYATFAVLGLGLIIETNIIIFNSLKSLSIIFEVRECWKPRIISLYGIDVSLGQRSHQEH